MNESKRIFRDAIVTDLSVLRQKSKPTSFKEIEDLQLVERIQEAYLDAWSPGVGLAAIQIGLPLQMAWYRVPDLSRLNGYLEETLINPKIISLSGGCVVPKEGCLSIPDTWTSTRRYQCVVYTNNGVQKIATGFRALVIQHEIDHMSGILCIDRKYSSIKIGRNNPCPCGSEKKYKRCCIDKPVKL